MDLLKSTGLSAPKLENDFSMKTRISQVNMFNPGAPMRTFVTSVLPNNKTVQETSAS